MSYLLSIGESTIGLLACLVREISAFIAKEVLRAAQKAVRTPSFSVANIADMYLQNVDRSPELRTMTDEELLTFVNGKMWNPLA